MKRIYTLYLACCTCLTALAENPPFRIAENLFDHTITTTLGLDRAPGLETITIFSPTDETDHYSNGVVLADFKGDLYCMWQSSKQDEDAEDTWVAYSRSTDQGLTWTAPMVLCPTIADGFCASGGWLATDDKLIAFINVRTKDIANNGGYTQYMESTDGLTWSKPQDVKMADGTPLNGIAYEKVFFSDNDNNKTSANYGGHYLLNVNSSGHIGSLSYKSCQIKYKRGGIRARSTFQIDNLSFDDCILDSIGGYGIAMCEGSSCISNITMKNCTAANCNRTLVNSVTTAGDINIENCTFVYCVAGNRNFDDVKTCKSFNVKNCILGISGDSPANVVAEGTDATGFRAWVSGADPVPTATGLYFTSDLAWRLTAEGTPAAKFDGTILGTDTKSTFKDPEHSDFTLTSPDAIKAKVGDPRWLP